MPTESGGTESQTFSVLYRLASDSRAALQTPEEQDAFLRDIIASIDDLADEEGNPLAYDEEVREQVLALALGADRHPARLFPGRDGGAAGKLKWAGRAWATGSLLASPAADDELARDAALWGIPAEALAGLDEADGETGLWPENEEAVLAFLSVASQFRCAPWARASTGWASTTRRRGRAGSSPVRRSRRTCGRRSSSSRPGRSPP